MAKISSFLCLFSLLFACSSPAEPEVLLQARSIALQKKAIRCEMQGLEYKATSLWDSVSLVLDQSLPNNMPVDERRNMLKVRNTSLIQMFMAYDSLEQPIQTLVENAGKEDEIIAGQMRQKMQHYRSLETKIDSIIRHLQITEPNHIPQIMLALSELEAEECE